MLTLQSLVLIHFNIYYMSLFNFAGTALVMCCYNSSLLKKNQCINYKYFTEKASDEKNWVDF